MSIISLETIASWYALSNVSIEQELIKPTSYIAKINSDKGIYILKYIHRGKSEEQIKQGITIYEFLKKNVFPCPTIIPTVENQLYTIYTEGFCFLLSYIEGKHPDISPMSMEQMGILTAKLHTIPCSPYTYTSSFSIPQEREMFISHANESISLPSYKPILLPAIEAFNQLPDLSNLPQTLIHSDIHEKNIIQTGNYAFYLIDLDDAGIGTTIIDLGYVLSQVCIRFDNQILNWKKDLAQAFLKGYQSIRILSGYEKENLIYAMQFCALAYTFHYYIKKIDIQNWERYIFARDNTKQILSDIFMG